MTTITTFDPSGRKEWRAAFSALRGLLSDANDTGQVFRIMRALNTGTAKAGYDKLLNTTNGGAIACRHVELADRLSDPTFIGQFLEGSLGAAYARFLSETGYSAQGLAAVSKTDDPSRDAEHPYAWFARRTRDIHDIWHILTGYRSDDPLGEACLTAFSFAQTGGPGWAMIAVGGALQAWRSPAGFGGVRAVWEGYRRGRRAAWLQGEDYEQLLEEPLVSIRQRLNISPPAAYDAVLQQR
ncbi:Coq4 family protein [Sphingobium yanoikuyae]|uniref:Coq4 family protein n=1 Tax=Sphingobium yanoikuyae TaxID=13690 RepID=UPI0024318B73|nr:Coq4 family protein [Sphingobium yanoikuyae]